MDNQPQNLSRPTAIIILAAIVAIIIVGGYFLWQDGNKSNVNNINNNDTAAKTSMVATEQDLINKKIIFTNSYYNYKISFPDDWTYDPVDNPGYVGFFDSVARAQEEGFDIMQGMKIEILVSPINDNVNLEQKISGILIGQEKYVLNRRTTIVDKLPAIEIKEDMLGYSIVTFIKRDNNLYTIPSYIGDPKDIEKYTTIYNAIVSSFTFLETADTSTKQNISMTGQYSWDKGLAGLTDWSNYQLITDTADKWVGSDDCGSKEFASFKEKTVAENIYKLILPGDLELIWTPNYEQWSNKKFLAFNQDNSAICAVGGRYPLKAYSDRLLWVSSCGSGFLPDKGTAEYNRTAKCEDSLKRVDIYFK